MPAAATDTHVKLPADTNQALGIAQYAIDFLSDDPGRRGEPDQAVLDRTALFFADATICGLSALALETNAPTVLRDEALQYPVTEAAARFGRAKRAGATVFGSGVLVQPEKAIVANSSAVREWDSNGTNFGYNPQLGHTAGEFGHNDFYPVCIAAAQLAKLDGAAALRAMVCHDEIRGRLAEVFSLKDYKIDHVVHGAIASAAVFGAMLGAKPEQIESAIGMVVAHAIPFRAIRAGKQLSDSKGASAAISTEFAITAMKRSMMGFVGPKDIFRNPEAIFRIFEGPGQMFVRADRVEGFKPVPAFDASPFELVLGKAGSDFAVMGMHFKLGLYEHQSAGAIQALLTLFEKAPYLLDDETGGKIAQVRIAAYEPAFGIIGDPAKRDPQTRQSADHSMVYIVATMLRKALAKQKTGWTELMLGPYDYAPDAIHNERTRALMERIAFEHGGAEYDKRYPDGIPTSLTITDADGTDYDSGMVMYPGGHARNTDAPLAEILDHKFKMLGELAFDEPGPFIERFRTIGDCSADEVRDLHDFEILTHDGYE